MERTYFAWLLGVALLGCGDDTSPQDTSEGSTSSTTSTDTSGTSNETTTGNVGSTSSGSTGSLDSSSGEEPGTSSSGAAESSSGGDDSGSSSTGEAIAPELVVVTHGRTVTLFDLSSGTLVDIGEAEIPGDGLLMGHEIFGAALLPGQQAFYVGSANNCGEDGNWCWGNGRIDRFSYDENGVTHDGAAYIMDDAAFQADGISCAEGVDVKPGQQGDCAPVGVTFSPDGSRFYVDDDDLDGVQVFSVEGDGTLSFIAEGASTSLHGLAIHPSEPVLYNGTSVIQVAKDAPISGVFGNEGNATAPLRGDETRMVTTLNNSALAVFDISDALAPVVVDETDLGGGAALFQDHVSTAAGSVFVVSGRDEIRTVGFNGTDLGLLDERIYGGISARTFRGVTLSGDPSEQVFAVAAYFQIAPQVDAAPAELPLAGEGAPPVFGGSNTFLGGGAQLFALDATDGSLMEVDDVEFSRPARVALALPLE